MNRRGDIVRAAIAILIICLVMAFTSGCEDMNPPKPEPLAVIELEVGQVWQEELAPNPFDSRGPAIGKIIALKDGYVQYVRIESGYAYPDFKHSMIEAAFRFWKPILIELPIEDEPDAGGKAFEAVEGTVVDAEASVIEAPLVTIPPTPPVWGKGELPADFAAFFGTDNNARLNKAQSDMLNRQQVVLHGLDQTKDGQKVHIPGVIDSIRNLDGRMKALEAAGSNEVVE